MDVLLLAVAGAGLFVAGLIKGVTGLGYSSFAIPFLVLCIDLKPAMAVVVAPALATNISLSLSNGHIRETALQFKWLYLMILPGVAAGVWLLAFLPELPANQILAVVILAYVALALLRPRLAIPGRLRTTLQIPTGFLNGMMTGLTGTQVMPLFPYMMALHLEPDRTVQAVNLAVLMATTMLAAGLVQTGVMTPPLFAMSLAALVPALIGVEIGNRARRIIPADMFRRIVLVALSVVGALLFTR